MGVALRNTNLSFISSRLSASSLQHITNERPYLQAGCFNKDITAAIRKEIKGSVKTEVTGYNSIKK